MAKHSKIAIAIATCFGIGKLPYMPGTWASFFSIVFLLLFFLLFNNYFLVLLLLISLFALGIWAADKHCHYTGNHDSREIVIDEVFGQILTIFIAIPFVKMDYNFFNPKGAVFLLVAFILFRLLDIIKPWPINFIDNNVKKGIGVMLDDAVAGLIAGLIIVALLAIIPR